MMGRRVSPDLSLPTEPMLFGILLLLVFKLLQGYRFDKQIMKHPITIVILVNIVWIAITSLTSTIPRVSFKFLLSHLWLIVPSYFVALELFKSRPNIKRFIWLYIIPFIYVIFYTLYQHSLYGFEEKPANWVVKPFYNDHTSYGAMLAMLLPVLIGFIVLKKESKKVKAIAFVALIIFTVATVFSYTRAAWVGLLGAGIMFLLLKLKVQFRTLFIIGITCAGLFFIFQSSIVSLLAKNTQDSSTSFAGHLKSITNVSTDASNKERINRWNCAIRMFSIKPIFGYGPGTYSFQYAPFQVESEKTIISTNAGDAGNAHSEYLGPLAERGLFGALLMITIVLLVVSTGMRLYYTLQDKELKILTGMILLGLVTYIIHGILNNFLDTDKVAIPFWGFVAMLTAIDIYHTKTKKDIQLLESTTE